MTIRLCCHFSTFWTRRIYSYRSWNYAFVLLLACHDIFGEQMDDIWYAKGRCYGYQTHLNSIYQKEFYRLSMHDQRTWESEYIAIGKSSTQFATNTQRGWLLLKINLKWHPFGISGVTVSYDSQKGTLHSLWWESRKDPQRMDNLQYTS